MPGQPSRRLLRVRRPQQGWIANGVVLTGAWGRPGDDTIQKLKAWNTGVNRIRCRIENIFGTWKRSYGLRRMRWKGLAKATLQVRLTATAYNLKRAMTIRSATAWTPSRGAKSIRNHEKHPATKPFSRPAEINSVSDDFTEVGLDSRAQVSL